MTAIKNKIWKYFLDPIVRKIESRLHHFQTQRAVTHDGSRWHEFATIGKSPLFYAESSLSNKCLKNHLRIGDYCHIRGEITVAGTGDFEIGHHSFLGAGSKIWCRKNIKIGSYVLISHLVDIHDSNSHSLDPWRRREECIALFEEVHDPVDDDVETSAVTIEDDVWIGFKSSVLKGVTIGRGAIVAACSVVTKDVPPHTLVAGNPARIVRTLSGWDKEEAREVDA